MKNATSIITHTTTVGGNIFRDLGFPPGRAAKLKRDADVQCQKLAHHMALNLALAAWVATFAQVSSRRKRWRALNQHQAGPGN